MYSYLGIVNDLLKEFPEISKNYAKEIAWIKDTFKGQETGGKELPAGTGAGCPTLFLYMTGCVKSIL